MNVEMEEMKVNRNPGVDNEEIEKETRREDGEEEVKKCCGVAYWTQWKGGKDSQGEHSGNKEQRKSAGPACEGVFGES